MRHPYLVQWDALDERQSKARPPLWEHFLTRGQRWYSNSRLAVETMQNYIYAAHELRSRSYCVSISYWNGREWQLLDHEQSAQPEAQDAKRQEISE